MARLTAVRIFLETLMLLLVMGQIKSAATGGVISYNYTIRVSNQGNDAQECWKNESFPCKSIEFAMKKKQLNHTRILLEKGAHHLSTVIRQHFLAMFSLEGIVDTNGSVPSISCNVSDAGLYFGYCYNISLVNIQLKNCGAEFKSTNVDNSNATDLRSGNISTALHIVETSNVNFSSVTITQSVGYGAVFYDVIGNVLMSSVTFSDNREKRESAGPGYASGGGIYIEFRPNCQNEIHFKNSDSNYTFEKCYFLYNQAEKYKSLVSQSTCKQFISFGRGGGISYFARGNSSNNHLYVKECLFHSNHALWGAGIFAEFDDKTGSNMIVVENSKFLDNVAHLGGGGVRIGTNSDRTKGYNVVTLKTSTFVNNSAHIGGGFAQYRSSKAEQSLEKLTIENCNFSFNVANRGAAMNLILVSVDILNLTVSRHHKTINRMRHQGEGAVYFYSCNVNLIGQNYFGENDFTAMMLESSNIKNIGNLLFLNNTGMDGGGMALYGNSIFLMVPKSTLRFENNTALKKGGAFYVEATISSQIQMNSTELKMHSCFFMFGEDFTNPIDPDESDTMTYFIGNSAPDAFGSNIYADTISDCRRDSEPKYDNSAFRWKVFKFIGTKYKDGRTTVVTNPVKIANISFDEWSVYPGLPFSPKVVLLDENYNSVFGNIRVTVTPEEMGQVRIHGPQLFLVKDRIDYIRFDGAPFNRYSLRIETSNGPSVFKSMDHLTLKRCPLGYYHFKKTGKCLCLSQKFDIHLGVTKCDSESSVYILNGRWGDPLVTNKSISNDFASQICPENYCRKPSNGNRDTIDHKFVAENQCAEGRNKNSLLCGECESGKSVKLGIEDCTSCDNNFGIFWLLLLLVFLTIVVLFIILLNVDTYATSLNAFLFSYQIIPLCTHGNTNLDIFMKFVIGVSTLSGSGGTGFGVCVWEHMNDLQKMFLNYIIPMYLIFCIFVISKVSYYFSNQCFLNRRGTVFRSFVFISVIAYSDFTRITFDLLHPVKVRGKWIVYKAGFSEFFHGEHIPYAIIAICVAIFIVILFPLLLMFSHVVIAIPRFDRLRGVFDSFNEPFRRLDVCDIFCAFYFLTRLVLLIIYIFIPQGTLQDTIFAVICVAILLIFVYIKPYTTESMNIYDSILLMNITVLAVINVGLNGVIEHRLALQQVAHALTYVPIACAAVKVAIWCRLRYQLRGHRGVPIGE